MADKDNLNLGGDAPEAEKKSGGKGKLIIVIVAVVVLLGGGAAAFLLLSGGDEAEADAVEEVVEEAPKVPLYLDVEKLLVNLEYKGKTRYVQAEMQLMGYSQDAIDQASRDMPAIRDGLITLFSVQDFGALKTIEGKDALRADALKAVNQALGLTPPDGIEKIYFENFVLQ
ncbi:flagellar basal body-associated FliL family protein [Congregibacter litoralis]|uniref:Flagellar protein FliL n=1 Tax=Congregibacter litoralis KT71 TaxID=314285 RepID=A4A5Z0_9GAMM|nr:flagellar basal body-associated FliL family protein [Congregibacter litoralis]EAQ98437.1 Flagellar basal body-associated protein [Congregibacter litoralis KT71]